MTHNTRRLIAATTLVAGIALAAVPASADQVHSTASTTQATGHEQQQHLPRVVQQWADAWNTGNPAEMGALFAADGTYTDHAFQASFTGPAGAEQWVEITSQTVSPAHITVKNAFSSGDNIAVTWTFSGTFTDKAALTPPWSAAGKSFSVPATSVFTVHHGRVTSVDDYYNLADVFRQVGLPAGPFTPPSQG